MSGTFPNVIHFEDFNTVGLAATVLGTEWEIYNSVGNAGFGVRSPGQVQVVTEPTSTSGGKVLQITAQDVGGQHYSGGVKLKVPQTYGQYEIRVRVSDDASAVTSGVVLLWPESNQWPRDGEIDWWETFNNRTTRTPTQSYVHRLNPSATPPYDASDDQTVVGVDHTGVDQSDWHKIVCSWAPDELSISIDNGTPVILTQDTAHIPDWPMELCLQLDAWSATPPATPITMQVDYVLLRNYLPASLQPKIRPWQWFIPPTAYTTPTGGGGGGGGVASNLSYWSGSAWVPVTVFHWDGSVWKEMQAEVNYWDGSAWQT